MQCMTASCEGANTYLAPPRYRMRHREAGGLRYSVRKLVEQRDHQGPGLCGWCATLENREVGSAERYRQEGR